jgi:hypothetical protein
MLDRPTTYIFMNIHELMRYPGGEASKHLLSFLKLSKALLNGVVKLTLTVACS